MKVVPFVPRRPVVVAGPWQAAELDQVIEACAASLSRGEIGGWETGRTELGDPQLYLLGPAPDHDCLLCLTRLGSLYVLEDGEGRLIAEHDALNILTEQVRTAFAQRRSVIGAKLVAAWVAAREFFEEKVEPVLAEPVELLSHVAPQLAALA